MNGFERPARRSTLAALGLTGVVALAGVASAQGGGTSSSVDSFRSVVHMLGVVTSLILVVYGQRTRERYEGGSLESTGTAVIVGGAMFATAFALMELNHGLGINVFAPLGGMQLRMGINMTFFTGTVFAFGWAFYNLLTQLEEWYT